MDRKKLNKSVLIFMYTLMIFDFLFCIGCYIYVWIKVNQEPVTAFGVSFPWWLIMFVITPIVLIFVGNKIYNIILKIYVIYKRRQIKKQNQDQNPNVIY